MACREGKSTTISAHSGTVRSVNFSSNGRMLMSSSDDKTVKVWALPSQRFMFTLSGHANWVRTAQFSPDCRLGVSGSDDKSMRIWDIQSKRLLRIYDEHAGVINSVAFHPDGTCVASAGTDKVIKVWDIRCVHFKDVPQAVGRKQHGMIMASLQVTTSHSMSPPVGHGNSCRTDINTWRRLQTHHSML